MNQISISFFFLKVVLVYKRYLLFGWLTWKKNACSGMCTLKWFDCSLRRVEFQKSTQIIYQALNWFSELKIWHKLEFCGVCQNSGTQVLSPESSWRKNHECPLTVKCRHISCLLQNQCSRRTMNMAMLVSYDKSTVAHSGWDWFIMHVKLGHSMNNGFIFKKINKN